MSCPCYKCEERKVGCHATCERYKEWREWLNIRKNILSEAEVRDFILDSIERRRRAKNERSGH